MKTDIFVGKCNDYNVENIMSCIKNGFDELGGINKYIKKNENILIKPNFLSPKSVDSAVTTHPVMIMAVCKLIRETGAKCSIGDSPGLFTAKIVASKLQLIEFCKREGIEIIEFNNPVEMKDKKNRFTRKIVIAKEILKFDKIINIPKMKTHSLTTITCAMKNIFGVIPGLKKSAYHFKLKNVENLSRLIVELNMLVKPIINIVDGIVSMEGDGPSAGNTRHTGLIIMGDDTAAVDVIVSVIMNIKPYKVPVIYEAKKYLFGCTDINKINVKGERLYSIIVKDFKKAIHGRNTFTKLKLVSYLYNKFFAKKPHILDSLCTGCSNCYKICPAKTIKIENKKAVINYKNCIKCYCCAEVCPEKAIKIKRIIFTQ